MRIFLVSVLFLIVITVQQGECKKKKEDSGEVTTTAAPDEEEGEKKDPVKEFQGWFSSDANFKKFIKDSHKKFVKAGKDIGIKPPPKDKDDDESSSEEDTTKKSGKNKKKSPFGPPSNPFDRPPSSNPFEFFNPFPFFPPWSLPHQGRPSKSSDEISGGGSGGGGGGGSDSKKSRKSGRKDRKGRGRGGRKSEELAEVQPRSDSYEVDKKKETDDVSVAAKTFAFYANKYGCSKSKVYKTFLTDYKTGATGDPDNLVGEHPDDKWLMKLANSSNKIDADGSATTSLSTAEKSLKGLGADNFVTLMEGEVQMPIAAQVFVQYVRYVGCQDAKADHYDKFKSQYTEAVKKYVAKKEPKFKFSCPFYVAQARVIAANLED